MQVCGIAVQAATYAIDKLYDYTIPKPLQGKLQVGCRVLVPFGRGNKKVEGMVLLLRPNGCDTARLKAVTELLDTEPVLDAEQIRLAVWLKERLYCTFFDCLRIMLPSGLWFRRKEVYELVRQPQRPLGTPLDEVMALFAEQSERTLTDLQTETQGRATGVVLSQLEQNGYIKYRSNIVQKSQDKMEKMLSLAIDPSEAMIQASAEEVRYRQRLSVCCLMEEK